MSERRIPGLDGLRGVAILSVIAAHNGSSIFWTAGQAGVVLFFVLSGFLITRILASQIQAGGGVDYRAFYLRRAARLGPALVVYLIGCLAFAGVTRVDDVRTQLDQLPYVLVYLTNWRAIWSDMPGPYGAMWSLAIEEQFYLVWPMVLAVLLGVWRRRLVPTLAIGIGVSVVLRLAFSFHADPAGHARSYLGTDTNAYALLLGCAVALAGLRGWRAPRPALLVHRRFVPVHRVGDVAHRRDADVLRIRAGCSRRGWCDHVGGGGAAVGRQGRRCRALSVRWKDRLRLVPVARLCQLGCRRQQTRVSRAGSRSCRRVLVPRGSPSSAARVP